MTFGIVRQVVILVGGRGTRLGDVTRNVPKPLLPIADDRPFLDYLLELAARHGYEDILLLAGHLGDSVERLYQGRKVGNAVVRVLRETSPLGTAGALMIARHDLDDAFIMMNGDALFDINLRALEQTARAADAVATLALRSVPDGARFGSVIEDQGRVTAFAEKDETRSGPGVINGGVYVMRRSVLNLITSLPCSMERDIFPILVKQGKVAGREFPGYFLDVGLPETLARGHIELPRTRHRPAAFLDRDGVINVDEGYTYQRDDLRFIDGAPEAIARLNDAGYYVFVVTNQAGVARGYYSLADVDAFHAEMQSRLAAAGAHIDCFYVAPYHPEGVVPEFSLVHEDRKPGPGMLLKAMAEWPVLQSRSFLIGDKPSDIEAAQRAAVQGFRFSGGNLDRFVRNIVLKSTPDCVEPAG